MTTQALLVPRAVDIVTDDVYNPTSISVHPLWAGVDRENVGGWSVGKNMPLARRLAKALAAGVVYSKTEVCTDNYGQTYVHGTSRVMGRTLNADLRRLGF